MKKHDKKEMQEQLRAYRKEYDRIKARIRKVGFICKGSLVERRLPCGNPSCQCHKDPEKLHGPYYQLSWKEKGKTVSHFLTPKTLCLYRQWIDNHRMLTAIINDMLATSRKVGSFIRNMENQKKKSGKKTRKPIKKSSQTQGYRRSSQISQYSTPLP